MSGGESVIFCSGGPRYYCSGKMWSHHSIIRTGGLLPPPLLWLGTLLLLRWRTNEVKIPPLGTNTRTTKPANKQKPTTVATRTKEIERKTINFARFQQWKAQRRATATACGMATTVLLLMRQWQDIFAVKNGPDQESNANKNNR